MPDRSCAVGDDLPAREFVADDGSMRVFSLIMDDPNPIHFDTTFVRQAGLGDRLVNQGTLNLAYPLDVLIDWAGAPGAVQAFSCRFRGSVLSGDRVRAAGTVTAIAQAPPHMVTVSLWLDNADGVRVLDGTASVLLEGITVS